MIAQAHGLAQQPPPTAPPTGPVQDTPGAELTAHQLMAQAHGMSANGRHGGIQAMYPGGQPPAVYSEAQPTLATQHESPAPAASAPTQPVRKPLMAGAARPIRTGKKFRYSIYNIRWCLECLLIGNHYLNKVFHFLGAGTFNE